MCRKLEIKNELKNRELIIMSGLFVLNAIIGKPEHKRRKKKEYELVGMLKWRVFKKLNMMKNSQLHNVHVIG